MDPHAALVLVVHLLLIGVAGALIVIDLRSHRLPDVVVLPTIAALLVLIALDALVVGSSAALIGAGLGMLILGGFYSALRAISREGMGGGDVKLAVAVGLLLGWHGWTALAVGAASAFVLAAVYASTLMLLRRADGSTRIAFGPWMILGAALGVLIG